MTISGLISEIKENLNMQLTPFMSMSNSKRISSAFRLLTGIELTKWKSKNAPVITRRIGKRPQNTIWNRSERELWEILELARNGYIESIKKYHPDNTFTGNVDKAREVNDAWNFIKELFARRGYVLGGD